MSSIGKILNYVVVAFLVTFFVGCSSIYNYKVEPTPIKKGEAKLHLFYYLLTFNK